MVYTISLHVSIRFEHSLVSFILCIFIRFHSMFIEHSPFFLFARCRGFILKSYHFSVVYLRRLRFLLFMIGSVYFFIFASVFDDFIFHLHLPGYDASSVLPPSCASLCAPPHPPFMLVLAFNANFIKI